MLFARWGRRRAESDDDYTRLIARSLAATAARRDAQVALLRLDQATCTVDEDAGLIVFTRAGDRIATAPVQVIGTFDPADRTWRWAWDHPDVDSPLHEHARRVREWGESHAVPELTTGLIPADDGLAWRFAAVACELNCAQGVWRCDDGGTALLVTFGTVTLNATQPPGDRPVERTPDDWAAGLDDAETVDEPEVVELVREWLDRMSEIESRYRAELASGPDGGPDGGRDPDAVDDLLGLASRRAIDEKQPVYERLWRREDEYHRPCSVGEARWCDAGGMQDWKVYRLTDDAWRVTYREPLTGPLLIDRAFDVQRFADGLRIVDHLD